MIRTMYDPTPEDDLFIDEPFNHYERSFNFFVVSGEVLDSQKRNQLHLQAGHSHSSGGGYISNGSGYVGGVRHRPTSAAATFTSTSSG